VVDVGCGGGGTSRDIAHEVGPNGTVLGIDISPELVTAAERCARVQGLGNVSFHCADATTVYVDGPPFDRLFSRFGLMFFQEPYAAFANLRRLLRAGGRLDASVWSPVRENHWIVPVMGIIGQFVELPKPIPRAPGPFALSDLDYLRELLERGGFGQMEVETWEGLQPVGGPGATPEEATTFVFDAMGFGKVLEESAPEVRQQARAEVCSLFDRHHSEAGVWMSAQAYLVSASA
jgi:SAM-dependent methyltransferase